jgi:magnesium transporter
MNSSDNHKLQPSSHSDIEMVLALEKVFNNTKVKIKSHEIIKLIERFSVIDLSYVANQITGDHRKILYTYLPSSEEKIKFILNTDNETRKTLFNNLQDVELKKLFEKMPADEAVWVMEDMSDKKIKKLFALINPKIAYRILELKRHAINSAGRLMTSDFFAFKMDITIKSAVAFIRDNPNINFNRGVFIIGEQNELLGYIPSRNLIVNPIDTPLKSVIVPVVHKVTANTSREEVIEIVEKYKVSSLPVVDEKNTLLGVITHEDVLDAVEDSQDEIFSHIAGVNENINHHWPLWKLFFARSPWLVVTLFAGLINVFIMSFFQKYDGGILTFVLFFVPLITGMSGNIGIQSSTILVRNLALGSFSSSTKKEMISKELMTGTFTGLVFGVSCGIITYLLNIYVLDGINSNPIEVAMIVSVGLIGACFTGSFLGVLSPLFFSKVGIDPAVASGPIVTAFNDCLSMVIYFLIAFLISNLFF